MVDLIEGGDYTEKEIRETLQKIVAPASTSNNDEYIKDFVAVYDTVTAISKGGDIKQEYLDSLKKLGLAGENGKIMDIARDVIKSAISGAVAAGKHNSLQTEQFRYENVVKDHLCQKSFKALSNIASIVENELTSADVDLKSHRNLNLPKEAKDKAEERLENSGFDDAVEKIESLVSEKIYKRNSTKVSFMASKFSDPDYKHSGKISAEKFEIAVAEETGNIARHVIEEFTKLNSIPEKAIGDESLQRVTKAIENEITHTLGLNSIER